MWWGRSNNSKPNTEKNSGANSFAFTLEKRKCDLSESCGLQSLTSEVARADALSRDALTAEFLKVAIAIAAGPRSTYAPSTCEEALAALATLIALVS